ERASGACGTWAFLVAVATGPVSVRRAHHRMGHLSPGRSAWPAQPVRRPRVDWPDGNPDPVDPDPRPVGGGGRAAAGAALAPARCRRRAAARGARGGPARGAARRPQRAARTARQLLLQPEIGRAAW